MPEDNNQKISAIEFGKLLGAVESSHESIQRIEKKMDTGFLGINGRVRKVEIRSGRLWGGIVVIGVVIPLLFKYIL